MRSVLCCAGLLFLNAVTLSAQVSTGTITGYVRDSSDAVIVGAKVTIVQQDTGERRETVTNELGEFNAPYRRRGVYSVTVSMTGFKSQIFSGVVLAVDQMVRLPMVLQPGVVSRRSR